MIVLGADSHKRSHTVQVGARGFAALLIWARALDSERVWALEDCRHVSGALERFLIGRGERVVRVSTRLMAGTRRSSRERGKSDQIDAVSVARAALAAGIDTLPTAALAGVELDLRLLVDHRERLVRTRVALNSTLQWNLHDLWPELSLPGGALFSNKWSAKIVRRLARAEPRRQPPDQRRHPPDRRHPRSLRPGDAGLHRAQERRRQDQPRRHPLPQTTPHPPHLEPPPRAHPDHRRNTHTINSLT